MPNSFKGLSLNLNILSSSEYKKVYMPWAKPILEEIILDECEFDRGRYSA